MEKIYGRLVQTIILSEIVRIMRNTCDIFTKTLNVGYTMNCMKKNINNNVKGKQNARL